MKQIEKNTVRAENQLKENDKISYINPNGKGLRVLFVGNSITRHGVKADIGWYNDWGMAASIREKDYVHIVAREILKKNRDACFCICQAAGWERKCYGNEELLHEFAEARKFGADIVIMRIAENCPREAYDFELFQERYGELISFLAGEGGEKIIVTTSFWDCEENNAIRSLAQKKNYLLVELSDLGEDDSMKAIGAFEHTGVANHPGDKGMQAIAERILEVISF